MARRNNSRRMSKRPLNLPLVGDPSPLAPPRYNVPSTVHALLSSEDVEALLENMTDEELFNTALSVGVKATDALGIDTCGEHFGFKELGNKALSKLSYARDVVWCHSCFTYYRST